jgi:CRP-like cAMP-binding protein
MSNSAEILAHLKTMTLCQEFSEAELEAFAELMDPVKVKKGELVVQQDEHGDSMYILLEGAARVVHRNHGKHFELSILQAGNFFGELALVDEGPRSADVEALEDCMLLSLDQGVIRALAGVYPSAAFKLLVAVGRVLVTRMRASNKKYIDSLLLAADPKD